MLAHASPVLWNLWFQHPANWSLVENTLRRTSNQKTQLPHWSCNIFRGSVVFFTFKRFPTSPPSQIKQEGLLWNYTTVCFFLGFSYGIPPRANPPVGIKSRVAILFGRPRLISWILSKSWSRQQQFFLKLVWAVSFWLAKHRCNEADPCTVPGSCWVSALLSASTDWKAAQHHNPNCNHNHNNNTQKWMLLKEQKH